MTELLRMLAQNAPLLIVGTTVLLSPYARSISAMYPLNFATVVSFMYGRKSLIMCPPFGARVNIPKIAGAATSPSPMTRIVLTRPRFTEGTSRSRAWSSNRPRRRPRSATWP